VVHRKVFAFTIGDKGQAGKSDLSIQFVRASIDHRTHAIS